MFKKIGGMLVGVPLLAHDGGAGAGGGTGTGDSGAGTGSGGTPPGTGLEIPKTVEELQKLLQSEADKRVSGALKTAQEKWELDYKAKLELEKAEAAKLAKMSEADKAQALLDKSKLELETREKSLAQKELKLETINILNDKKLPITFADILLGEDADKTKANVDTFDKAFREAVEAAVNERLKGNPPKGGTGGNAGDNFGKKVAEAYSKNNEALEKARQSYFD
jgi:hypothetical protein